MTTYCGMYPVKVRHASGAGASQTRCRPGARRFCHGRPDAPGAGRNENQTVGYDRIHSHVGRTGCLSRRFSYDELRDYGVAVGENRPRHAICLVWVGDDCDHDCREPACRSAGRQVGSQGLDGPERHGRSAVNRCNACAAPYGFARSVAPVCTCRVHRFFWRLSVPGLFCRSHGNASKAALRPREAR